MTRHYVDPSPDGKLLRIVCLCVLDLLVRKFVLRGMYNIHHHNNEYLQRLACSRCTTFVARITMEGLAVMTFRWKTVLLRDRHRLGLTKLLIHKLRASDLFRSYIKNC